MTRISFAALFATVTMISAPAMASDGPQTFADWDLNGDGVVTLAEARDNLANTFLYFDTNNDGYLDQHDNVDEDTTDDEGDYAVDFEDDNLDERISLAEFTNRADDWIQAMDRNGDGAVTLEDFGGIGFN